MSNIYQQEIITRSLHPLYGGALEEFTHVAQGANLSCGDEVTFHLLIEQNQIKKIRHISRACAICTASADMIAETLEGKAVSDIKKIRAETIQEMMGIKLSPVRLKCALLPLETLKNVEPKKD